MREPAARLDSVLWQEQLFGFPPFSRPQTHAPMVCFSESPIDHINWLIGQRGWPPWALIVSRQRIYDLGGGPVWHARSSQYESLTDEQRSWAVRLDTGPFDRSEWMHEREWRLPVAPARPWLDLDLSIVAAILVGDPSWQPSWRQLWVETGRYFNGETGEEVLPDHRLAHPHMEVRPVQPRLWQGLPRLYWDAKVGGVVSLQ
jgi:hypothetical protein